MAVLSGVGIYEAALRFGDPGEAAERAAEAEELGYTALWTGDIGGDLFGALANQLRATRRITVASGVLNLWMHEPHDAAAGYHGLVAEFGPRVLIGIGISHAPLIDRDEPGRYRAPLATTAGYLDELDKADPPLPVADRVLAALGPKMLRLARGRTAGAHPYLATPEHTATARDILGHDRLLAPEQGVVLETDPATARAIARKNLAMYIGLPNYVNNWLRHGFTADDVAAQGSDRLVDAVYAWGDEEAIAARVRAHVDAGADHVAVQVLTDRDDLSVFPGDQWRRLAPVLTEIRRG
jgi:probable F420-dependent oxidoreductase